MRSAGRGICITPSIDDQHDERYTFRNHVNFPAFVILYKTSRFLRASLFNYSKLLFHTALIGIFYFNVVEYSRSPLRAHPWVSSASAEYPRANRSRLWGNPPHLNYLRQTLEAAHPDSVHVFTPKTNADYMTYDGIEVGGERVAHEIEETIAELMKEGARLTKISVIGYSLGGVVARYAIGLLYKHGVFEKLKPTNFTTFASLWIGIRSPKKGIRAAAWNAVAPRTLSVSGKQMFTIDKFRDTNRPLLVVMADPTSIFMRALKEFKNKSLYANTMNDRSVPYYTAAFSRTNPFVDLEAVDVHYLPGQDEKVLLDTVCPASPRKMVQMSAFERFQSRTRHFLNNLPIYAFLTIMLPIGATFMICNGAYQSYKSSGRIRSHEAGQTSVDSKRYRIPLLEETQAMQDRAMERITNIETSDEGFPQLALNSDQLEMIQNLETLGIKRYAAHIQKVRHTHAAIIVRYESPEFSEGVAVVHHWAQNFEP